MANEKHQAFDQVGNCNTQFRKIILHSKNRTNSISAYRNESQNNISCNMSSGSNQRVPFGEKNSILQQSNRNSYSDIPLKFMRTNNHEMIPSSVVTPQKENVSYLGSLIQ